MNNLPRASHGWGIVNNFKGWLYMNSPFWRDVQSKDPTSYDALLKMIRRKIINGELRDH